MQTRSPRKGAPPLPHLPSMLPGLLPGAAFLPDALCPQRMPGVLSDYGRKLPGGLVFGSWSSLERMEQKANPDVGVSSWCWGRRRDAQDWHRQRGHASEEPAQPWGAGSLDQLCLISLPTSRSRPLGPPPLAVCAPGGLALPCKDRGYTHLQRRVVVSLSSGANSPVCSE